CTAWDDSLSGYIF
nr:immunoglobulin light chain junction region [Macaca mulatta]MPO04015.1 immunoglobulin light chain junction region [Macaca mulatta]MPO05174.1 immunoglobulin light chain junction region [Macaca mulatta]MPO05265.1 immunoglobulin light chain junction region [Macaca mulatta]MPO07498.1 immunoglobulin light chain junction region [Macaca mulatta]